jgi:hypothetical protein
MRRILGRFVAVALAAALPAAGLAACAGRVSCESPCWPGPMIGPTCPGLCCEPPPEMPCPPCPPRPPCNEGLPSGAPPVVTGP